MWMSKSIKIADLERDLDRETKLRRKFERAIELQIRREGVSENYTTTRTTYSGMFPYSTLVVDVNLYIEDKQAAHNAAMAALRLTPKPPTDKVESKTKTKTKENKKA